MQWGLILILFLIALGFAIGNVVVSQLLGPSRKGRTKDTSYESGVEPLGSTRDRFNVRFYLVAMIFLVFDVEVLFLLPWITIFNKSKNAALHLTHSPLFGSVLLFSAILLIAYVYAWGKGVFKWD
ncbi:MAG: NADH-quinone oxidoreductase subunit A [Phycisphaerales bacterium]|nr:NADH-quinone oxidoreductase subunit A [Phycisphaerales bacterium]